MLMMLGVTVVGTVLLIAGASGVRCALTHWHASRRGRSQDNKSKSGENERRSVRLSELGSTGYGHDDNHRGKTVY